MTKGPKRPKGNKADFSTTRPASTTKVLQAWFDAAHNGAGTPWLRDHEAEALARHAMEMGEGVSLMEAAALSFTEPPRDNTWEIIGLDPQGDNWEDHRDPARAFDLLRHKLALARRDGVRLQYKLWLSPGAV